MALVWDSLNRSVVCVFEVVVVRGSRGGEGWLASTSLITVAPPVNLLFPGKPSAPTPWSLRAPLHPLLLARLNVSSGTKSLVPLEASSPGAGMSSVVLQGGVHSSDPAPSHTQPLAVYVYSPPAEPSLGSPACAGDGVRVPCLLVLRGLLKLRSIWGGVGEGLKIYKNSVK